MGSRGVAGAAASRSDMGVDTETTRLFPALWTCREAAWSLS